MFRKDVEKMSLEELQAEAQSREISIRGRNRFQLRKLLEQESSSVENSIKTKGEMDMSQKWTPFFAGVTVVLNALALVILVFPLGLPLAVVRWGAAGVVGLDLLIEIVLFARS